MLQVISSRKHRTSRLHIRTSEYQRYEQGKVTLHGLFFVLAWLGEFSSLFIFLGGGGLNTIRGRVASVPVYLISDVAVDVASTRTKNLTLN